jgi:hypothetical protein
VVVVLLSPQAAVMVFFMKLGGMPLEEAMLLVHQHPVAMPTDLYSWDTVLGIDIRRKNGAQIFFV